MCMYDGVAPIIGLLIQLCVSEERFKKQIGLRDGNSWEIHRMYTMFKICQQI